MGTKPEITVLIASIAVFSSASLAQTVDATNTLPNARPGQCYAKVLIPAEYETKTEEVLVAEEAELIEPVEAVYEEVEEQVLVEQEDEELIPVPAVYETVQERIEISPRETLWVTNLGKKGIPVNPAVLETAKSAGVDVESVIPGMCFHEYYRPAQYKAEDTEILVKQASEAIEIIPAEYEWIEKQVLVKEAAKKIVEVPASYENITEQVLVEPAKTVWKKGNGLVERVDHTTGEIMCLVEIPAKYKTISKRVVKSAATVEEVEIPAEYTTIKVRNKLAPAAEKRSAVAEEYQSVSTKIKESDPVFFWHAAHDEQTPEGSRTGNQICFKEIPAKYHEYEKQLLRTAALVEKKVIAPVHTTVKVNKLVSNASEKRSKIPAEYKTVTKRNKIADERLEWREVLCETNMTEEIVTNVQAALQKAGYDVGTVDGIIGGATLRAVDSYQKEKGLPRGGLTIRTLDSLGIEL